MKRCYSLKRNKEFRYAYRAGRSVGTKSMVLIYAKGKQDEIKIGFSVSKKLGNAVTRNRIKRRLREAVTPLIPDLKRGYKIVIIAKMPILTDKLPAIASGMQRANISPKIPARTVKRMGPSVFTAKRTERKYGRIITIKPVPKNERSGEYGEHARKGDEPPCTTGRQADSFLSKKHFSVPRGELQIYSNLLAVRTRGNKNTRLCQRFSVCRVAHTALQSVRKGWIRPRTAEENQSQQRK